MTLLWVIYKQHCLKIKQVEFSASQAEMIITDGESHCGATSSCYEYDEERLDRLLKY